MAGIVQALLKLVTDRQSVDQSAKALATIDSRLKQIDNAAKAAKQSTSKLPEEFEKAKGAADDLVKEIAKLDRAKEIDALATRFANVAQETGDATKAVRELQAALKDTGASAEEVRRAASVFENVRSGAARAGASARADDPRRALTEAQGDVSTGLGAAGSVASLIPGGGVLQSTLQAGGDIAGLLEYRDRLIDGAKVLGRSVTEATGPLGVLARTAQGIVPQLGAAGAGLLALGAAGAAFAVIGVGLAAVFGEIQQKAQEARENTQRAIAVQEQYFDLLATGTTEEARAAIEQRRAETEALREFAASIQQDLEAAANSTGLSGAVNLTSGLITDTTRIFQEYNEAIAAGQDVTLQSIAQNYELSDASQAYIDSVERLNEQYGGGAISADVLRDALDDLNGRINSNVQFIELTTRGLEQEAFARGDAAAAAEEARQREEELTRERERAQQVIDQLAQQEIQVRQSAAQQTRQITEDRKLAELRDAEDYAEEAKRAQDRLLDIQRDGSKRLEDLRVQSAKDEAKRAQAAFKDIAKTIENSRAQIAKVETDAERARLKQAADFTKARLRAEQDAQDEQFSAILTNDILRLAQSKSQAAKESQRSTEDFQDEQREAEQQKELRIAEIREESALRIEETKARLEEERQLNAAALIERVQAEQQATQQRLAAERESAAEQEAARQKRLERQREDEAIADRRRREAVEAQLSEIQRRREAELRSIQQVGQTAGGVFRGIEQNLVNVFNTAQSAAQNVINNLLRAANAAQPARPAPNVSNGRPAPPRLQPRAFAEGGIVRRGREVLGLFEGSRNYDEAVMPLNRQTLQQVLPGLVGGGNPIVNFNAPITVGDGLTQGQVRDAIFQAISALLRGNTRALMGVR